MNTVHLQDQRALFLSPKTEGITIFISIFYKGLSPSIGWLLEEQPYSSVQVADDLQENLLLGDAHAKFSSLWKLFNKRNADTTSAQPTWHLKNNNSAGAVLAINPNCWDTSASFSASAICFILRFAISISGTRVLYGLYVIHHYGNSKPMKRKASHYGVINSKISNPINLIALGCTISIFSIIYENKI